MTNLALALDDSEELSNETGFKDGDDGDYMLENVIIKPVDNGYILQAEYLDGDEIVEVFVDKSTLLGRLKEVL